MSKKYIKIIEYLSKKLENKEKFKKSFNTIQNKVTIYSFISSIFTSGILTFVFVNSFTSTILQFSFFFVFLGLFWLIFLESFLKIFVTKKIKNLNFGKFLIFHNFDSFLERIINDVILNLEKDKLLEYTEKVLFFISCVDDSYLKHHLKIKLLTKLELKDNLESLLEKKENNTINSDLLVSTEKENIPIILENSI